MKEMVCSDFVISDRKNLIQIEFLGRNEFEFFVFKRYFDYTGPVSEFYTDSSFGTEGFWTYIKVILDEKKIVFSFDKEDIKIRLNIGPVKFNKLTAILEKMIGLIGSLIIKNEE